MTAFKRFAEYSEDERKSLKNVICNTEHEGYINYYLRCCAARDIDPFSGYLYMQIRRVKDTERPVVAMTIDGARMQASRSGQYAGNDEPEFDSEDGEHPNWARCRVWRKVKGERYGFTAKVRWKEYKPKPPNADFQWKDKPFHMLAKCAEMQALRKAFPESVYDQSDIAEEVSIGDESASSAESSSTNEDKEPAVSPMKWVNIVKAFEPHGITPDQILARCNCTVMSELTAEDVESITAWWRELSAEGLGAPG